MPTLVALSIVEHSPTVTIGSDDVTANELEKLGVKHKNCITSECVVDEGNKVVTTHIYMDGSAKLTEVFTRITKLVQGVIRLA